MTPGSTHLSPVEAQTFAELTARWADLPPAGRAQMFDGMSTRAQAACWADVRRYADGNSELENIYEGRQVAPYCPECGDRTVAHAPGACLKHRPSHGTPTRNSTASGRVNLADDDPLKAIPAAQYLPVLTGEVVSASG